MHVFGCCPVRVPESTATLALLRETGPLAITSANPSGQPGMSQRLVL
jgi:tRNA A37 threonylcarbamoyladenosine synthetase subunit TsaC/SUA5/YrdC